MVSGFKFSLVLGVALAPALSGCTPVEPNKVPVSNFISGSSFNDSVPFDAGSDASYVFDSTKIELVGGVARLKAVDSSDDTASEFGAPASGLGASWGTNSVKLANAGGCDATSTNCSEFASSWTPQWSSMITHLKLNGSGTIANSASIPATIGTAATASGSTGSFAYGAAKLNQGITFDGSNNRITWNTGLGLTGAYTMSFWVKLNSFSSVLPTIISGTNAGAFAWEVYLNGTYSDANNGTYAIGVSTSTSVGSTVTGTFGTADLGNWHHIVITYDKTTTPKTKIYKDALLQTAYRDNITGDFPTHNKVQIGIRADDSSCCTMNGTLDEFGVWNVALSGNEVKHIYDRQSASYSGSLTSRVIDSGGTSTVWTKLSWTSKLPTLKALPDYSTMIQNETNTNYSSIVSNALMTGIVGLWHLNETSGTTGAASAKDSSGNLRDATPNSGVTFGFDSRFLTAVNFNGSNGSLTLPNLSLTSGTISLWLNPKTCTDTDARLFSQNSGVTSDGGATRLNLCGVEAWTGSTWLTLASSNSLSAGVWNHITVMYSSTSATLYINGVQKNTVSTPFNFASSSVGVGSPFLGSYGGYFSGSIDEIAVWNRVLSVTEAQQLYARGGSRLKFQVRSCNMSNCSDGVWKGPDGTSNTYFSELFNMSTQSATPSGRVLTSLPEMSFANFTPPSANRYFQYRSVLESDSSTAAIQPELQSVTISPGGFNSSQPTIATASPIAYRKLDDFTESLGASGCSAGVRYTASLDGSNWLYWDGTQWTLSNGSYAQADPISDFKAGFGSLINVLTTNIYLRAHLNSAGSTACEIDQLSISGTR